MNWTRVIFFSVSRWIQFHILKLSKFSPINVQFLSARVLSQEEVLFKIELCRGRKKTEITLGTGINISLKLCMCSSGGVHTTMTTTANREYYLLFHKRILVILWFSWVGRRRRRLNPLSLWSVSVTTTCFPVCTCRSVSSVRSASTLLWKIYFWIKFFERVTTPAQVDFKIFFEEALWFLPYKEWDYDGWFS